MKKIKETLTGISEVKHNAFLKRIAIAKKAKLSAKSSITEQVSIGMKKMIENGTNEFKFNTADIGTGTSLLRKFFPEENRSLLYSIYHDVLISMLREQGFNVEAVSTNFEKSEHKITIKF